MGQIKPIRINTKGENSIVHRRVCGTFPTAQRAADGWVKSFAAIEGGEVTTDSQIVDIVLREAATHFANHYTGPVTDLISRRQVEEALRKTKSGSARGPDGITVDFLQLLRTWSVIQFTILFARTSVYIQAPIQYKGGSLFALLEGKGAHADMEMYRSILLASVIGKIPARAHRLANLGALVVDLSGEHSWQCGGVPGLGTEFPVFAIRLLEEKTKA